MNQPRRRRNALIKIALIKIPTGLFSSPPQVSLRFQGRVAIGVRLADVHRVSNYVRLAVFGTAHSLVPARSLTSGRYAGAARSSRSSAQRRHGRLLRTRRQRPRCGHAAEKHDELAAPHSITSSARSRKDSGIDSLRALAVVRSMTSSNLVGCSTGRSAGFAPLRILSTYSAERRNRCVLLAP
jgi:hypothetical protein